MPKRKAKSDPPSSTVKTLPRSKEALALLLRTTEQVLAFLEPYLDAQGTRLKALQKTLQRPPKSLKEFQQFLKQGDFLQAVAKASRNRFAQGGPPLTALMPYLESSGWEATSEKRQLAVEQMLTLTPQAKDGFAPKDWKPCLAAFSELVAADRAAIGRISELQHRIIAALDEAGADTTSDTKANSRVKLPESDDAFRLARMINNNIDHERSKSDIAHQFTGGDEKRARTLLRQLRRYPGLLRKRKK